MIVVAEAENLRQRKKTLYRIMAIEILSMGVGATVVGLAVGLSENSAGWGFAAAFIFLGFCIIGSLAVLAYRGQLRNTGRLYGKALRQSFSGKSNKTDLGPGVRG